MEIRSTLINMSSEKHQKFLSKLIPNVDSKTILGIKNPELKKLAKTIFKEHPAECEEFLKDLPHLYLEENMLHSYIISNIKDYDLCLSYLDDFKSYIDNWAVCDSFRGGIFQKNTDKLYPFIKKWIASDHEYTKRLAMGLLLSYYLGQNFNPEHLKLVADNNNEEYYVKMMVAWYFSMALVKQYEHSIGYLEKNVLDSWTHNKTIQKAVESKQIAPETKLYLKSLKVDSRSK